MTTVLLCDDHRVVRAALALLLESLPGVHVVPAGSGEEVLAVYPSLRPEAVLLDVRLPGRDGVDTAVTLLGEHPDAHVLILTGEVREEERLRALRSGVLGYLDKAVPPEELCAGVLAVAVGQDLLDRSARRALEQRVPTPRLVLSDRELQVLHGMAAGRSNAQIGRDLWVSEDTVKVHAKRLFAKTGVHDRAAAVAWAFRTGVLA